MHKSFYLWLTALLGGLLFFIIHQALFLLYWWLTYVDFARYSFGMTPVQLSALELASLVVFVFCGGWYGVWLGMNWYGIVYESGDVKGFFYALWGKLVGKHVFSHYKPIPSDLNIVPYKDWPMPMPVAASEVHLAAVTPRKPAKITPAAKPAPKVVARKPASVSDNSVKRTVSRRLKKIV